MNNDTLPALVASLPEVYQPIYGHPELSACAARECSDRLHDIFRIHDALQQQLQRPVRVLDLGCAQGFVSLSLAARGAQVSGLDFQAENIAVCRALAEEQTQASDSFQATFSVGRIEERLAQLAPGQVDMVLGLSVFHHVVHRHGLTQVQHWLTKLAACCQVFIAELALREEPLYWGISQPESPRELLAGFAFVHEVARFATHLSAIQRPLYLASNRCCYLDGRLLPFEHWTSEPHAAAQGTHQNTRRYYFGADFVAKHFLFNHALGQRNRDELQREQAFLQHPPAGFAAPACLLADSNDEAGWLVQGRQPGRQLLDLLRAGTYREQTGRQLAVLAAVLDQLVALEHAGLYHDDLRTWNVLVTEDDQAHLIDFGSVSDKAQDCSWPGNLFLSLLIFVHELSSGEVEPPEPLRSVAIGPWSLAEPFRRWAYAFWQRPASEWRFGLLRQLLDSVIQGEALRADDQPATALSVWSAAMEDAYRIQAQSLHSLRAADVLAQQQLTEMAQYRATADRATQSLNAMETSLSWRMTWLLRVCNPKRLFVPVLRKATAYALRHPRLLYWLKPHLERYPCLWQWLKQRVLFGHSQTAAEGDFVSLPFANGELLFAQGPLADQRGIGRVTRELLAGLQAASAMPATATSERPCTHFYASIHWCPETLPPGTVVMIHDVIPLLLPQHFPEAAAVWADKYRKIARQADSIVTISESSAADISRLLDIPVQRISIIYNGISRLPVGNGAGLMLPASPYLVFLGSHDHHKNIDIVLRALCCPEAAAVSLVLIGDNLGCRQKVQAYGLQQRVHFLGRQGDAEIGHVLSRALALVFPSLYEGFGLPPLEAALLGVPSICSRRPAMTELLQDVTLFADPDQPEHWAAAIGHLQADAAFRQALGQAARTRAQGFTWQVATQRLLQVCEQQWAEQRGAASSLPPPTTFEVNQLQVAGT